MIDNCSKPQASLASTLTVLFLQITDRGKWIPDVFQTVKLQFIPPGLLPVMAYMGRLHLKRVPFLGFKLLYERVRISLVEVDEKGREIYLFGLFKSPNGYRVHTKNCNHFQRTFQGPPTRNIISQIVQKCSFPVHFSTFFQHTCLQSIVDYCIKQRMCLKITFKLSSLSYGCLGQPKSI